MTTSSPGALAWSQDRTIVRYPDPAVETLDPRFERYRLGAAMVERLWTGALGRGANLVRRWSLSALLGHSQRSDLALE